MKQKDSLWTKDIVAYSRVGGNNSYRNGLLTVQSCWLSDLSEVPSQSKEKDVTVSSKIGLHELSSPSFEILEGIEQNQFDSLVELVVSSHYRGLRLTDGNWNIWRVRVYISVATARKTYR
ncbi:hypothetical protein Tco_0649860 [Tanacetum coccineum]